MKTLPFWARLCLLLSFVTGVLPNFALATSGPTITTQPQPAYVNQGATATISVTATASSTVTYQWEMNGSAIPGANASSLTIANVQPNEGGNYDVVVTAGGIAVTSALATITVITPPSFSSPTTSPQTAIDGSFFQVYTSLQGTFPFTYSWTKDGVVQPSQNQSYLNLNPVTTSSAGTYVLTASNSAGSASSNAIVVTVVEPILISALPNQTVTGGGTITLAPAISGPGTLTYQWSGPNGMVVGATGPTLTLTNVDARDMGSYGIWVTNAYQSVQGNVYVVVNAAPYINIQPASQSATNGFSFFIYAGIQGAGPLTYQWSKDGVTLQDTPSKISGSATPTLSVSNVLAGDAGAYTLAVTNPYGSTTSNAATIAVQANPFAPVITTQPAAVSALAGSLVTFSVVATDPLTYDTMTYQWYKGNTLIAGSTGSSFILPAVSASDAGTYSVAVSNTSGSTTSAGAVLTVGAAATLPVVTIQPVSQTANVGASVTLTTAATGNPAPTFQWQKNGTAIAGATSANLLLSNLQVTDAGAYSVIATNIAGSAASSAATVTVTALPTARVINLSTRAQVGTGDNILIAGFIINGSTPKKMLIRAVGPALANYSISNFLADPSLKIVDSNGNTVASNDDWGVTSDLAGFTATSTQVGAVPFAAGSKDSALVATLAPGGYTALVTGNNNTTGVALMELYEVDTTTANQLINISSRAQVGTGASVTIAGVIVSGSAPQKFLVRAIGPGLQARGVAAFLPDPQFDIVDSSSSKTIATNDDWETSATVADVKAVTASMGVSPLAAGSKDSALTITLAPGGYTVVVRGSNSSSGIALVELYQVP